MKKIIILGLSILFFCLISSSALAFEFNSSCDYQVNLNISSKVSSDEYVLFLNITNLTDTLISAKDKMFFYDNRSSTRLPFTNISDDIIAVKTSFNGNENYIIGLTFGSCGDEPTTYGAGNVFLVYYGFNSQANINGFGNMVSAGTWTYNTTYASEGTGSARTAVSGESTKRHQFSFNLTNKSIVRDTYIISDNFVAGTTFGTALRNTANHFVQLSYIYSTSSTNWIAYYYNATIDSGSRDTGTALPSNNQWVNIKNRINDTAINWYVNDQLIVSNTTAQITVNNISTIQLYSNGKAVLYDNIYIYNDYGTDNPTVTKTNITILDYAYSNISYNPIEQPSTSNRFSLYLNYNQSIFSYFDAYLNYNNNNYVLTSRRLVENKILSTENENKAQRCGMMLPIVCTDIGEIYYANDSNWDTCMPFDNFDFGFRYYLFNYSSSIYQSYYNIDEMVLQIKLNTTSVAITPLQYENYTNYTIPSGCIDRTKNLQLRVSAGYGTNFYIDCYDYNSNSMTAVGEFYGDTGDAIVSFCDKEVYITGESLLNFEFYKSIISPSEVGTYPFYFIFNGEYFNSSIINITTPTYYQQIPPYNITFNFYDLQDKTLINNVSLNIIGDIYSANFTTLNGSIFIGNLSQELYHIYYSSNGYNNGYYYFLPDGTHQINTTLYLQNSTTTTTVGITVYDNTVTPLEDVYIKIMRYDLETNSYILQDIIKTNFEGKAIANLILNTEYYRFLIEYPLGDIKLYTTPTLIFETTLVFQIPTSLPPGEEFYRNRGINSEMTFDNTQNRVRWVYSDPNNNIDEACLYLYKLTINQGKTFVSSTCAETTTGILLLNVLNSSGSSYVAEGYISYLNSEPYLIDSININFEESSQAGKVGIFFIILLMLCFAMVGYYSTTLALILTPLPLILGSVINLIDISIPVVIGIQIVFIIIAVIVGRRN